VNHGLVWGTNPVTAAFQGMLGRCSVVKDDDIPRYYSTFYSSQGFGEELINGLAGDPAQFPSDSEVHLLTYVS
jgi:hypothetical protein